jgi:hypothetical protein
MYSGVRRHCTGNEIPPAKLPPSDHDQTLRAVWLATQVTPGGRDTKLCLLPAKHVQGLNGGLGWVGKVGVLKPEVRCFSRRPFVPSLLYTDTTCRMTTGDGSMYDVKPSGSCSSDRSVCGGEIHNISVIQRIALGLYSWPRMLKPDRSRIPGYLMWTVENKI